MNDDLISIGSAVKAMPDGTLGGYLVRFTGPDEPDQEGEYFTKRTDFWGPPHTAGVVFHHGFAKGLGKRRIGWGKLSRDEQGVAITATLDPDTPARDKIIAAAKAGKLGWSSGSANHLVVRDGGEIKQWPLIEASLTYTPVDPKARVMALKAIMPKPTKAALPATLGELEAMIEAGDIDPSAASIKAVFERLTRVVERLEAIQAGRATPSESPVSVPDEDQPVNDSPGDDVGRADRLRRVLAARLALMRSLGT